MRKSILLTRSPASRVLLSSVGRCREQRCRGSSLNYSDPADNWGFKMNHLLKGKKGNAEGGLVSPGPQQRCSSRSGEIPDNTISSCFRKQLCPLTEGSPRVLWNRTRPTWKRIGNFLRITRTHFCLQTAPEALRPSSLPSSFLAASDKMTDLNLTSLLCFSIPQWR